MPTSFMLETSSSGVPASPSNAPDTSDWNGSRRLRLEYTYISRCSMNAAPSLCAELTSGFFPFAFAFAGFAAVAVGFAAIAVAPALPVVALAVALPVVAFAATAPAAAPATTAVPGFAFVAGVFAAVAVAGAFGVAAAVLEAPVLAATRGAFGFVVCVATVVLPDAFEL